MTILDLVHFEATLFSCIFAGLKYSSNKEKTDLQHFINEKQLRVSVRLADQARIDSIPILIRHLSSPLAQGKSVKFVVFFVLSSRIYFSVLQFL